MWYLSFYCNPRIQLAVVSKILMEGLLASATLYGEFMEKYVYSESAVDNKELIETYDMTSVICIDPEPAENVLVPGRK